MAEREHHAVVSGSSRFGTASRRKSFPVAPATGISAACERELRLIFKEGHTEAIRNYVLTPHDVIVMDTAASRQVPRIALSGLNLPAPERAARKDGLDFSPPAT